MKASVSRRCEPVRAGYVGARPWVSVLILTLNEEINIRDCLASCTWCDDVHVLDSGSEDRTVEIARELGAHTHFHPFESFGAQRNWAIDNVPMKHRWVFHLDADERFTPELVRQMEEVLSRDPDEAGFHVPNKLMFMGNWLRRSGGYPTYQMRLFHLDRMRFIDWGHGQREQPGTKVGKLGEPYLHFAFSKGVYDWLDKHNRYSSLEALKAVESGGMRVGGMLSKDPVVRRRAWKDFGYLLPLRPQLRWFYTLFVKGGLLEGSGGWTLAKLLSTYESMIATKMRLLRMAQQRSGTTASDERFETDTMPGPAKRVYRAADRDVDRTAAERDEADLVAPAGDARAGTAGGVPVVNAPRPVPAASAEARTDATGQMIPEASPWTFREKLGRVIWMLAGRPVFRLTFHNWYELRAWMLRLFGAKIGRDVRIRPSVHVEIPWNIEIDDGATVGDEAILYSLGSIRIGKRTIVSQYAHLCAGTHDFTDRRFPLIRDPIEIGDDAWIGADSYVGPNVHIGRLCVLGARSSAYKNLDAGYVYVGNPARRLKERELD